MIRTSLACCLLLAACSDHQPNGVFVEVAPEVVSSLDGTLQVDAQVYDDELALDGQSIRLSVAYVDRNGTDHPIEAVTGITDARGGFAAGFAGLDWEGTGVITAEVLDGDGNPRMIDGEPVAATASFSVLDRTPPTVEILPPTADLHVGPGLPITVQVHVADEIGVSQVSIEAAGELERLRTTVVASGSTDTTLDFDFDIPDGAAPGPTITLYALATDLSSNQAAATPVVLTVDPAVAIAVPPGLAGDLLGDGTGSFLDDPRALAVSPKDGRIYVADNSGGSPCNGHCIRAMATDGTLDPAAVVVGVGDIEGVAFDADGTTLYYTDRQDRLMHMTWNDGTSAYEGSSACNNIGNSFPQEPFHLVHDPELGVLVVDQDRQRVLQEAGCTGADPVDFSEQAFDQPRGIALGPAGEIYVSDLNNDEIRVVDRDTGNVSLFDDRDLDTPMGLEWLDGGASAFADTLLVADRGNRIVRSTAGDGDSRAAAFLRNSPVDVALDGATLYILTAPSAGDSGRIFVVTGF
ncbi:MAG TPA: hypothetical protein VL172_22900 [Kofleriaceae bacterium]|nr:hypothetical protein [Kofleriaceae bacterium]